MDFFTIIFDQLKSELCAEYSKNYTPIQENELAAKCVNGKFILQHIRIMFHGLAQKPSFQDLKITEKEIQAGNLTEDERITSATISINRSKNLIDLLFLSPFTQFNLSDKNRYSKMIKDHELCFYEQSEELTKFRIQLLDFLVNVKPDESHIRALILVYIKSTVKQLQCLIGFYEAEMELGNRFIEHVSAFLEKNFSKLKSKIDAAKIKEIHNIFKTLKRSSEVKVHDVKNLNKAMLDLMIGNFENDMQLRRNQLDSLKKTMNLLEEIVLELDGSQKSQKEEAMNESNKKDAKKKGSRMTFLSRIMDRFK